MTERRQPGAGTASRGVAPVRWGGRHGNRKRWAMGMDGGYRLYDVGGMDWSKAREVIRELFGDDGVLCGKSKWSELVCKALDLPSFREWIAARGAYFPWTEHEYDLFGKHAAVYHGNRPWLAPGVELVRVSYGDNVPDEADAACDIMHALVAAGFARLLISEETWT